MKRYAIVWHGGIVAVADKKAEAQKWADKNAPGAEIVDSHGRGKPKPKSKAKPQQKPAQQALFNPKTKASPKTKTQVDQAETKLEAAQAKCRVTGQAVKSAKTVTEHEAAVLAHNEATKAAEKAFSAWYWAKYGTDSAPVVNPIDPAKARGLWERMTKDGAKTFADKVAWIKKHMREIDKPPAFVSKLMRSLGGKKIKPGGSRDGTRDLLSLVTTMVKARVLHKGDADALRKALKGKDQHAWDAARTTVQQAWGEFAASKSGSEFLVSRGKRKKAA